MADIEGAKSLVSDIVDIQEPYIVGGVLFHPAFDIIWGTVGKRKDQRVAIEVAVSTR